MKGYIVLAAARQDITEIAKYTLDKFGTAQAYIYLDRIEAGFRRLTTFSGLGRRQSGLLPGLHVIAIEKHQVYYLDSPALITIVRVLHQSRLKYPSMFS